MENTSKKVIVKRRFKKLNILGFISLIIYAVFLSFFIKLDILPVLYLSIAIVVLTIIQLLGIMLINFKKKVLKVIGTILLLLSIIVHGVAIYYLYNTNDFLNQSFGSKYVVNTSTYYVVTSKDSQLTEDDITGEIAYFEATPNILKSTKKLQNIYTDVTFKTYEDVSTMYQDVYSQAVKFMYVESAAYNLVFDLDKDIEKDNYVVIDKIEVTSKTEVSNNSKDVFNIYIGGTDFTNECMDFNMIISINTKTNKIVMTSIPRDYYIEVAGLNGAKDKLSFMTPYGIKTIMASLENLFGIKLDYYLRINTTSLVEVVDQVGGITFCSDYAYTTTHALVLDTYDDTQGRKMYVRKGCQQVNGIQALTIARERNAFNGRDRVRQENCRKILMAILNKLNNVNTLTNYANLLNSFSSLYVTSLPKEVISNIVKTTLDNQGNWKIIEQAVDGTDSKDYIRQTHYTDWVMYPDMTTVSNASKNINKVINH